MMVSEEVHGIVHGSLGGLECAPEFLLELVKRKMPTANLARSDSDNSGLAGSAGSRCWLSMMLCYMGRDHSTTPATLCGSTDFDEVVAKRAVLDMGD